MTDKSSIGRKESQQIAKILAHILSNTFVIYVKTLNFHWNLVDPRFFSLHKMLQEQYEELAEAVDELAERIRGLQLPAPGSMQEFLKLASLKEAKNELAADQMLKELLADHEEISCEIRPNIAVLQKWGDEGSADLFIERLRVHEKTSWILRSHFVPKGRS